MGGWVGLDGVAALGEVKRLDSVGEFKVYGLGVRACSGPSEGLRVGGLA
jgi:hypothetical protein